MFKKLIFLWKKPCVVLISGKGHACAAEAVFQTLRAHFKVKKISGSSFPIAKSKDEILIFENELERSENIKHLERFKFLIKNSSLPVLIVTHMGEIPAGRNFFSGEKKGVSLIREAAEVLPPRGYLVLNFDDEVVREIKDKNIAHSLTYGFQKGADFQVADIHANFEGTNLKVIAEDNVVPFWIKSIFGKEQIYSVLTAICAGTIKSINLVEISQSLKDYRSLPGKMRMIPGIKNSLILDDSESATILSMIEALEILGEIGEGRRKIAVLGDVVGAGQYTIEAHEAIGEKATKNSDLLFAIGHRARFVARGAISKGMAEENIFQFDTAEEGKIEVQKQMKKDDLILVDGSEEIKMEEVVKEIEK